MESIHGHDVIEMIQTAGHPFSRVGLVTAITEKFGENARFHTCSAEGMTADGLVDFLVAKGKFFAGSNSLALDPSKICQH